MVLFYLDISVCTFEIDRQFYELRVTDHHCLLTNYTNNTCVIVRTPTIFVNIYNECVTTFYT